MILDLFRKGQSWFTKLILIVLAVAFAFGFGFSLSNFPGTSRVPQGVAAQVNDEKIPVSDFYRARDLILRQYEQAGRPAQSLNINFISYQTLNNLVDSKLLAQEAKRLDLRVSDEELSDAIKSSPSFQVDGEFIGTQAYQGLIRAQLNQSVGEFEKTLREELLVRKIIRIISDAVVISDEELFNIFKMRNEKANLYYLKFSPEDFRTAYTPTAEEIENYYNEHLDEFRTRELRTVNYIALNSDHFSDKVFVSYEEIKAYYDSNREEFKGSGWAGESEPKSQSGKNPTQPEDGATQDGVIPFEEARDEIEKILVKQRANQMLYQFMDDIKKQSDENNLAQVSQRLGVEISTTVPFAEKERTYDIPLQVVFESYYLPADTMRIINVGRDEWFVELNETIPPDLRTLGDMKPDIVEKLVEVRTKELAKQKADEVLQRGLKEKKTVKKLAKDLRMEVKETGMFSRVGYIPDLNSDDVKIDAFTLTQDDRLSPRVYEVNNAYYLVSLKEKQAVGISDMESKKTELRENELEQRKRVIYKDWVNRLKKDSVIKIDDKLFTPQG